jgi:hypothetical protein
MASAVLHEYPARRRRRALAAQVGDDRAAGVTRQRKHRAAPGLARPQADGAMAPVDVLEMQGGDLAGPESEAGQAAHDRSVPSGTRRGGVAACQQLRELLVAQASRKRGEPPVGDSRDCGVEPLVADAFGAEESEERPPCGADGPHRPRREPAGHGPDTLDHVRGVETPEVDRVVSQGRTNQKAHEACVIE